MRFPVLIVCFLVAALAAAQEFPAVQLKALRASQGLVQPTWDEALAQSCLARARVLAASGQLSHEDDQGRGPGLQLLALGFPPALYGEVLAAGADTGAVWKAWLDSPTHHSVLVDPRWTAWGWAKVDAGGNTVWVVRFRGL